MRRWCDLSPEIVKKVYSKLQEDSKIVLRSTCKKWGYSVSLHRLHPVLPLDGPMCFSDRIIRRSSFFAMSRSISLVPTVTYLLRRQNSTDPWWLVAVEHHSLEKPLRLYHPLTRSRIPIEHFTGIHSDLDSIKLSEGLNARDKNSLPIFKRFPRKFCVSKVMLWPDPEPASNNCSVVVLNNHGELECFPLPERQVCDLYFIESCTKITLPHLKAQSGSGTRIHDIELWKGKLWAVNCKGTLFGISNHTFKVRVLAAGRITDKFDRGSKRLLVSSDKNDLQLVCYHNVENYCDEFSVYKLNSQMKWDKLKSFGDKCVLFVGYDTCFFASTQHLKIFPGNCIVYPKNLYTSFSDNKYHDGVEFLGDKDYLELRMSTYTKGGNYMLISKSAELSAVFWPPPRSMLRNLP